MTDHRIAETQFSAKIRKTENLLHNQKIGFFPGFFGLLKHRNLKWGVTVFLTFFSNFDSDKLIYLGLWYSNMANRQFNWKLLCHQDQLLPIMQRILRCFLKWKLLKVVNFQCLFGQKLLPAVLIKINFSIHSNQTRIFGILSGENYRRRFCPIVFPMKLLTKKLKKSCFHHFSLPSINLRVHQSMFFFTCSVLERHFWCPQMSIKKPSWHTNWSDFYHDLLGIPWLIMGKQKFHYFLVIAWKSANGSFFQAKSIEI